MLAGGVKRADDGVAVVPTASIVVTTEEAFDRVRSPDTVLIADSRSSTAVSNALTSVDAMSPADDLSADRSDLIVSSCAVTESVPSAGSSTAVSDDRSLFS